MACHLFAAAKIGDEIDALAIRLPNPKTFVAFFTIPDVDINTRPGELAVDH